MSYLVFARKWRPKNFDEIIGQEHIATTLSSYANYNPQKLTEILKGINFSDKSKIMDDNKIEQIKKIILDGK